MISLWLPTTRLLISGFLIETLGRVLNATDHQARAQGNKQGKEGQKKERSLSLQNPHYDSCSVVTDRDSTATYCTFVFLASSPH
jgi:hypothetical protein